MNNEVRKVLSYLRKVFPTTLVIGKNSNGDTVLYPTECRDARPRKEHYVPLLEFNSCLATLLVPEGDRSVVHLVMGIGIFENEHMYQKHKLDYDKSSSSNDGVHEFNSFDWTIDLDVYVDKAKPFDALDGREDYFKQAFQEFENLVFPRDTRYCWLTSFWNRTILPDAKEDYLGYTTMIDGYYFHFYLQVKRTKDEQ